MRVSVFPFIHWRHDDERRHVCVWVAIACIGCHRCCSKWLRCEIIEFRPLSSRWAETMHTSFAFYLPDFFFWFSWPVHRPSCWTNFHNIPANEVQRRYVHLTNYDQNKRARDTKKKTLKTKWNEQNNERDGNTQTIICGNWGKRASNEPQLGKKLWFEKLFSMITVTWLSRNQCYGIDLWIYI